MDIEQAKITVDTYFASEAAEMYCILGGSGFIALCSLLLWFRFDDQFSSALAITLAVVALLLFATGASLLIRDGQNHTMLIDTLNGNDVRTTEQVIAGETGRMQKVADNYQNLRYTFAAFAFMGALLIIFSHHHLAQAIAVGLLVFAVSGTIIDRYSEVRALTYLSHLTK
jgi:hypothetical protein